MSKYIVYFGCVDDEIVYIGSGLDGREAHLNSGTTHVYAANKHHFEGKFVRTVIVWEGNNRGAAYEIEKELIEKYNPKWNLTKPVPKSIKSDPNIPGKWYWYKLLNDYAKTSPLAILAKYIIKHRNETSNTVLMPWRASNEFINSLTSKAGEIPDDYKSNNIVSMLPFVESLSFDYESQLYIFNTFEGFMETPGMYLKLKDKILEDHNRWNKEPITT